MADSIHSLLAEMADELDTNRRCLMGDSSLVHPLADRARAALAAEPAGEGSQMADPIRAALERLVTAYDTNEGLPIEEWLQMARAALAAAPPAPAEPGTDAVLTLAAIIRQAAGNGLPGAARLAELILSHPDAAGVFQPPEPAPAADGEREELAADLDECANSCVLAEKHNWAKHMRRAAALLRELETIAFAASDYLCAKKFPAFASEHGGLDLLEANLSRLVAHFEHGPRPVPGVDVPGPDGDYGGLQELCNAEGVDVRIGAPLLRRALAAWKQTTAPAPDPLTPPADREAEELAQFLDDCACAHFAHGRPQFARAAALLRQPAPAPVPVPVSWALGPWERPGWCDAEGRCWFAAPVAGVNEARWTLTEPLARLKRETFFLPHWAIPQPPQGEEVAE
jgi:hypothetical protein